MLSDIFQYIFIYWKYAVIQINETTHLKLNSTDINLNSNLWTKLKEKKLGFILNIIPFYKAADKINVFERKI